MYRGLCPMKGMQLSQHTTPLVVTCLTGMALLPHENNPETNSNRLPDGVCAAQVSPYAFCCRFPWTPHRLSLIGRLVARTLVATPFQSVPLLPPPLNTSCNLRFWDETQNVWRRVSSTYLLPACRRSLSLHLCRRIQLLAGAVRLCCSLARGPDCLRARTFRSSIAALPLRPQKTRES